MSKLPNWFPRIEIDEAEKGPIRKMDAALQDFFRVAQYLLVVATFTFIGKETGQSIAKMWAGLLKVAFVLYLTNGIGMIGLVIFPKKNAGFELLKLDHFPIGGFRCCHFSARRHRCSDRSARGCPKGHQITSLAHAQRWHDHLGNLIGKLDMPRIGCPKAPDLTDGEC
jgi:hypothetical protein